MPDGSGWSADTRNWPPSARDAPANGMKQDNIATVKTGSAIGPIESMAANPRRIAPEALEPTGSGKWRTINGARVFIPD